MAETLQSLATQPSPLETTWVARLTPPVPAAIATVALCGPLAGVLLQQRVKLASQQKSLEVGRIYYGLWQACEGEASEQVVVCRTQSDQVEIHCHGGNAVCQMILRDLVSGGAVLCSASEFPHEPSSDRITIEAAEDLQRTTSPRAAAILVDQLNGELNRAIDDCIVLKHSGDYLQANAIIEGLLQYQELGLHLVEPWRVVIAGPPNAGKSSLMNALVGQQRAIVHHQPGTTRDWIESLTAIDGWPVNITDTAGIRQATDAIEAEGITRAHLQLELADLVILVVDATVGWTEIHQKIRDTIGEKRRLVAWNKIDLVQQAVANEAHQPIPISASHGLGLADLMSAISKQLVPNIPPPQTAIPFRLRHIELLNSMLARD